MDSMGAMMMSGWCARMSVMPIMSIAAMIAILAMPCCEVAARKTGWFSMRKSAAGTIAAASSLMRLPVTARLTAGHYVKDAGEAKCVKICQR